MPKHSKDRSIFSWRGVSSGYACTGVSEQYFEYRSLFDVCALLRSGVAVIAFLALIDLMHIT